MKFFAVSIFSVSYFAAVVVFASFEGAGRSRVEYKSPYDRIETCVLPQPIAGISKSSKLLESEAKLCNLRMANRVRMTPLLENEKEKVVTICPKLNSTNPGVLFVEIPEGKTAQQVWNTCNQKQDTEAKFKQSISCSNTTSIIGAYHASTMMEGIGNVPAAVLRTLDAETHRQTVDKAISFLTPKSGLIYTNWKKYQSLHAERLNGKPNPAVFEGDFVIGVQTVNPKKEFKYTEINSIKSYENRYNEFQQKPVVLRLFNTNSIEELFVEAQAESFGAKVKVVNMMKDVSEMILLDSILGQQDRIGNIHFTFKWLYVDEGKIKSAKIKDVDYNEKTGVLNKVLDANAAEMQARGAVAVKEILLKDNDCGMAGKENKMLSNGILAKLRHLNKKTYENFVKFNTYVQSPEGGIFFKKESLMTNADLIMLRSYSSKVAKILKANLDAGLLKLDLNLEAAITE